MATIARILIVDDDPIVAESLAEFLEREGFATATAREADEALTLLTNANAAAVSLPSNGDNGVGLKLPAQDLSENETTPEETSRGGGFAVVVAEINLPHGDGMEFLRRLRKAHPAVVPVIVTNFGKIEQAVEAVKLGAIDYLTKPVIDDELRIAVDKALRQHALLTENQTLRDQLTQRYGLDNLVGADYRMQKVYDLVESVAPSKTTVLIEGESGTGKTMIARAVHTLSPRRTGPFATFACGSIPETLLESELFGHIKGAFTGADSDKAGKILAANNGTLFIDEINSATPTLQLKLLRVLQEKQFEPVGSSRTVHVDVRFVLATNQPLEQLVEKGVMRQDLYYRINVVKVRLPPLRERLSDIPLLADHFLHKYCKETGKTVTGFTKETVEALQRYHWPGNVRELENTVERAVVLCRRPVIDVADLPETVCEAVGALGHPAGAAGGNGGAGRGFIPAPLGNWQPMPLEQALLEPEKQIIVAALQANNWNRQETARQLNINRTTLYKKIKQFGLDEPN